jgi:hypothetical protein
MDGHARDYSSRRLSTDGNAMDGHADDYSDGCLSIGG